MPKSSEPNPLVIANCPKLAPLPDGSMASVVLKLSETASQYNLCRKAALND
jgi:hypothetical protein